MENTQIEMNRPQLADPLEVVDVTDVGIEHVADHVTSMNLDHNQSRQDLSADL